MASITDQNYLVWNQGKNPLVNFNFMLRVELLFDLPCKSVRAFTRELEYDFVQEGGLNDYVHMLRKPISKPFTLEVERYVGVDYIDPLPLGEELILPVMLFVSRTHDQFIPFVVARTYVFTGVTVMKKTYGDLVADQSGLLVETTTLGYREMLCVDIPWSEVGDNIGAFTGNPPPTGSKSAEESLEQIKASGQSLYDKAVEADQYCQSQYTISNVEDLLVQLNKAAKTLTDSKPLQQMLKDAEAALRKGNKTLEQLSHEADEALRDATKALRDKEEAAGLSQKQSDLADKKHAANTLLRQHETAANEASRLQTQLDQANQIVKDADAMRATADQAVANATSALDAIKKKLPDGAAADLDDAITKAEAAIKSAKADVQNAAQAQEAAQAALRKAQDNLSSATADANASRDKEPAAQNLAAETARDLARDQNAAADSKEKTAAAQAAVRAAEAKEKTAQEAVDAAQAPLNEATNAVNAVKPADDRAKAVLTEAQKRADAADASVKAAQSAIAAAQAAMDAPAPTDGAQPPSAEDLAQQLREAQALLAPAQQQQSQALAALAAAQAAQQETSAPLQAALAQQQVAQAAMDKANRNLAQAKQAVVDSRNALDRATTTQATLEERANTSKAQKDAADESLAAAKSATAAANAKLTAANAALPAATSTLEAAKDQTENKTAALLAANEALDNLKQTVANQEALEQAKENKKVVAARISEATSTVGTTKPALEAAIKNRDDLKKKLTAADEAVQEATAKIEALNQELAAPRDAVLNATDQASNAREALINAQQRVAEASARCKQADRARLDLQNCANQLSSRKSLADPAKANSADYLKICTDENQKLQGMTDTPSAVVQRRSLDSVCKKVMSGQRLVRDVVQYQSLAENMLHQNQPLLDLAAGG